MENYSIKKYCSQYDTNQRPARSQFMKQLLYTHSQILFLVSIPFIFNAMPVDMCIRSLNKLDYVSYRHGVHCRAFQSYNIRFDKTKYNIYIYVLRASKLSVLKINWNCNFVGLLHHPFWLQLVLALSDHHFQLSSYLVWPRITDEGSLPEMRIWSIMLIKSDLKWCIHLSRSLFLYFNYLVSVTAGGPVSPRGHMKPSSTVDFGWFVAFWEHQNCPC